MDKRNGPPPQQEAAPNNTADNNYTRCQRCRRGLRTAKSIAREHGPVCWHRRADAARRVPTLDCGCRDPWPCRCNEPPLTNFALDGWRNAARHVLSAGNTPMLPIEVLRALYRRGGADRALAVELHKASGGVAA